MRRINIAIVMLLWVTIRGGVAVGNRELARLVNQKGAQYIESRDLLISAAPAPAADQGKRITLLLNIMEQRRANSTLFANVDEAVQRARVAYAKLPDTKKAEIMRDRYQALAGELSSLRRRNTKALNVAMAELLWKTAQNDHERLNALLVLSLNSTAVAGVFEAAHDVLQETQSATLGQELLSLLAQYAVVYGEGSRVEVVQDIASLSARFEKLLGFQRYCLKILQDVDKQDSQGVLVAIRERIWKLTEAEPEAEAVAPVMAEDVEINIELPK